MVRCHHLLKIFCTGRSPPSLKQMTVDSSEAIQVRRPVRPRPGSGFSSPIWWCDRQLRRWWVSAPPGQRQRRGPQRGGWDHETWLSSF